MAEHFFAPCPRGLEAALAEELAALDAADVAAADGGVAFSGPIELAYRANLESRLASRILWQVGHGALSRRAGRLRSRARTGLAALVSRRPNAARRCRGHAIAADQPRIRHAAHQGRGLRPPSRRERRAAERQQGSSRCTRARVPDGGPRPRSTSTRRASRLFKRGYRRETAEAPLRENLAAGLLRLAGWQLGTALLDPMCGSGTIAIEAAMIARDIAPGLKRTFGFQKLAWYDGPTWQRLQAGCAATREAASAPTIHASDIDAAADPSLQRQSRGRRRAGFGLSNAS